MKGNVLDFTVQTSSGVISGDDGKRYKFVSSSWKDAKIPAKGLKVDFDTKDDSAIDIYLALGAAAPGFGSSLSANGRNRTTAGLFALLLGGLGVHKFYLGQTTAGILYLVFCWTFIPSIIALVEGITYLTMSDADFTSKYGS